jgi:hypothetical protein
MYTPAGKWDLSATIQHQRVERGVKNWRANLNCRDNTGVADQQTLLLWAQKCKSDGLKIFTLNALWQDITSNFSLSVKLWILLELLLLQTLLILDHLDSWLPPILCCVYERSACQLLWLRAVKKRSLKTTAIYCPTYWHWSQRLMMQRSDRVDATHLTLATWFSKLVLKSGRDDCFKLMVLTMYYVSHGSLPSCMPCSRGIVHHTMQIIWRIGIWLHDENCSCTLLKDFESHRFAPLGDQLALLIPR